MIVHGLIFVGIISFLHSTDAQLSQCNDKHSFLMNNDEIVPVIGVHSSMEINKLTAPPQNLDYGATSSDHRSWSARPLVHHHRHLRIVHGIVNIIGWGILLPIGVIAARFCKKLPFKTDDWYSLHIMSEISGFILGTVGWGLGMSFRSAAREHNMSVHGILGTIIFALTTIQVIIAVCIRPNHEEHKSKKYWTICHHILGYVLIIIIITNIYEGIANQNPAAANKWKWSYGVIVGAIAFIFLALDLLRWIKFDSMQ